MKTESKTKAQLIQKLADQRARVDELETKEEEGLLTAVTLQESESRFRNIFETSRDGIIFFDGKTRKIILGNSAMAELLGCSKEDLIGLTIPFLHPPEEWVWIEQEFQKHVSSEVYLSTEIPILRNDGSVFFADISSSLITLEGGTYFSTFFHDITERRQTKDLLVASEARLKAQYQGSPIPTFSWQKKGETFELVDLNRAAQEATWGEAVKYLGKTAAEIYQGRPEVLQDIHRCFTEKKVIKRELLSQHFIPGRTMIATYTFVPPDLIMVHAEDISERKRAEALIEHNLQETRVRFEVSQALAGKETEDEVLDTLIQQANLYPQAQVSILTFDRIDSELVGILRRVDAFSSGLKGTRFKTSEFPIISKYLVDQVVISNDIFSDENLDPSVREHISQAGAISFAGFRLAVGNELLGVILATANLIGYFDQDKQQLYQTLAEQGAVALRAARLREQISESQQRFRGLVETLSDWIWEVDQNGVFTYISPKIRDLLGYQPEELLGKTPYYLMPFEEAGLATGTFGRLLAKQQPLDLLEITCRHKSGRHVVFETRGEPFFDAGGNFKGYRGINRDITERKQAEEKLHQAEEKYRAIVENAVEGIFQSTPEGKFLTANTALSIILGYDSPEVFIKSIENSGYQLYADPSDRDRARKILAEQGVLNNFEVQVLRKNGERIWVNLNARLVRDGDGKILYYEGTVENISKRKQTEEALRLAEEKYRAIVENAVEGIFQSTIDGRFLMVNSALAKFHSYDSPEELIADISNIGEQLYVHPEDRQKYRQIIADEGVVKGFETQLYRKDGTIKWGSMNVRSVKDHDGHFLYYEGTIEDITARKEAEEGLQKSLEKLRKALGGIIQAMALTVETRDPYTAGHQRRVADLARTIAQEMRLSEDQVDGIRMAGIVHDLGKISIPAEILSKPSRLSDLEYSLIKVHPQISYDILKDIDFNWPVAQIVLQHHERLDGSGYPNGLSGKAISLEARILAVADVVEAISSHRPYRPAFGVDVALEEIEKNKAVLYEPEAVEACMRLFKEKGFKFE